MNRSLGPQRRPMDYSFQRQFPVCGRCGIVHGPSCRAQMEKCYRCKRHGHYARMCRTVLSSPVRMTMMANTSAPIQEQRSGRRKSRDKVRMDKYLQSKSHLRELPFYNLRNTAFKNTLNIHHGLKTENQQLRFKVKEMEIMYAEAVNVIINLEEKFNKLSTIQPSESHSSICNTAEDKLIISNLQQEVQTLRLEKSSHKQLVDSISANVQEEWRENKARLQERDNTILTLKTENIQLLNNQELTGDDQLDVPVLDPESDLENEAESQRVDLPGGERKPTNIRPHDKEEQLEDNHDKHPRNLDRNKHPRNPDRKGENDEKRNLHSKRIFQDTARFWPNGRIPYWIDEATYTDSGSLENLRTLIKDSINQLDNFTCVRWIERTTETDYVRIVNGDSCYSYVGVVGGAQNLSIEAPGCMTVHTVLHEFLHAMGGSHEQSRSDRASMTSMIWNKIDSKNMYNFVMENTKNALPYDYKSLMQYELDSFGKNRENSMSIPDMSFEYLITNKKDHLSLYDIGEINSAYRCTADCFNQCENGGVLTKENGQCRCKCPSGLKGEDCSELDTSDGCGGFIQLGLGEAYTINMDSYNSGVICTWVVKGTMGSRITAMVDFMDLPFNEFYDCYHWLEFRDYLIGDNGK
ncbi:zinc metalloproteinase dpy-31-like, partial [Saccostrea cucullata]|uniref:zinc metalloproteinase dpy-31-like n=2 Tax=Saccostrea cuccullata TaxID=36930 RepID=UPI002ED0BF94